MSIKQTRIWKFFSSIKLAIWLLTIIAALSLIGTLIPQNQETGFYIDKFGHAGYGALLKTGLADIYASPAFIFFLLLFSINLAVCLLNKFPLKRRSIGIFVSHLSILVILLGALIGMVYGEKGLVRIGKAEEVNSFMAKSGKFDLGFSIRLDDFIYSENIDPKEKLLVYSRQKPDNAQPLAQIHAAIGNESEIADTGYKVRILRYLPDFVIDIAKKEASTRSAVPNNPAIEVELKNKDGNVKTFWVFARFPDMHQDPDANFKFEYDWAGRRPKDFISKVTVLKGSKEIMRGDIRVNKPLRFGGYTFFQSTYDTEGLNWSGLQIVKDPGVPVVYTGFVLLIFGLMMIFYISPLMQRR